MKKKSLYIVGTNGLGVNYGGWDNLLSKITVGLSDKYDIYVYTSKFEAQPGVVEVNGARIKLIPLKANGFQSVLYDFAGMVNAVFNRADLVLVLGVSGGIFFPIFKVFKSKVILNPDGAEWKRSKWNALIKKFLRVSEKLGILYSDAIICDSKVISSDVKTTYDRDSHVIEYGGDHVSNIALQKDTAEKYGIKSNDYAFKVCRIVPENNIDLILEAFSEIDNKLLLVGNWNNSTYGTTLRAKYAGYNNLLLLDPIYDQEVLDELRGNCRLYVHGHSVGGTNPSLVEAMHLGLGCAVFDVNYNRETTENSALYFADKQELLDIIAGVWSGRTDIDSVAACMKRIAMRRYLWDSVVDAYDSVFEESCIQK